MKKTIFTLLFVFIGAGLMHAQTADQIVTSCVTNVGADAKYLKDFRVQLGKSASADEMRYKANMSLWKNTKYRFTMCTSDDSQGKLFLTIKNETDQVVLSTYDPKTGKSYANIDFVCNKSGIYTLSFDFINGQQGSGVGVVSMVK